MGRYTTLLKWHFADPVSPKEQARNDGVFSYQANRTPFVDHPTWVADAFVPALTIAHVGNDVWLSWANDYAPSVVVEQSAGATSVWSVVTNTPGLTSTNSWAITVPMQGQTRFFRFRLE